MKLSEQTIEFLKNYATLNQSLLFRKGSVLATITPSSTVYSTARVVESFPFEFAISDLNKLLSKLSLYGNPELQFEQDRIVFTSADGRHSDYIKFSSPKVIKAPDPNKNITMTDPDHEFDLSQEDLLWQRKSAGISSSPYMIFHADGKNIHLRSTNPEDDSSDMSSTVIGKTKSKFTYTMKIEYWRMLEGSYRVKLKDKLCKFEHTEKPIEYYLAIEKNLSSF